MTRSPEPLGPVVRNLSQTAVIPMRRAGVTMSGRRRDDVLGESTRVVNSPRVSSHPPHRQVRKRHGQKRDVGNFYLPGEILLPVKAWETQQSLDDPIVAVGRWGWATHWGADTGGGGAVVATRRRRAHDGGGGSGSGGAARAAQWCDVGAGHLVLAVVFVVLVVGVVVVDGDVGVAIGRWIADEE